MRGQRVAEQRVRARIVVVEARGPLGGLPRRPRVAQRELGFGQRLQRGHRARVAGEGDAQQPHRLHGVAGEEPLARLGDVGIGRRARRALVDDWTRLLGRPNTPPFFS